MKFYSVVIEGGVYINQPKPIPRKYDELMRNIETGIYQIPKFQRDFIWEKERVAKLLDSIIKGYPIGTFILWKTRDRLRSVKKIGSEIFKEIPEGDFVYYILDGQQRVTSLYLPVKGTVLKEGENYKEIYVDIEEAKKWFENSEYDGDMVTIEKPEHNLFITFHDLVNERTSKLARKFDGRVDRDFIEDLIDDIKDMIRGYEFSTIEIENQPLGRVTEIFTRINTAGKTLTLFEIMNAKVYQESNGKVIFDLEEEFNTLINELESANYETIAENRTILLQLISLILKQNAKRDVILSLPKEDFINVWDDSVKSLKLAIDKIRTYFRIPVSKLVPYYVLLVPIAYFYYINNFKEPNPDQTKDLEKYFFRSAFTNRFSSAVESKLNNDIKIIEKIKNKEKINWNNEIPVNFDKELLIEWLKEPFTASNAFDKGVLCILAYFQPKRFNDNGIVILDNSWLNRSNSKNYHHFFPKAYLKKVGKTDYANALANITFVDDYLNKREIKAKPPSKYILKEYAKINPHLSDTLKSHLIDDINDFGISNDDYDKFLEKRSKKILNEIIKRIGDV